MEIGGELGAGTGGGPDIDSLAEAARQAFVPPETGVPPEGTEPPDPKRTGVLLRRLAPAPPAPPGGVQQEKPGDNALLDRMGRALERARVFGGSVANFALRVAPTGALRYGARELAKGIFSWSGAAGLGTGIGAGAAPIGAFAGAVAGAVVEYARQVNRNLDQRLTGVPEADPELVGRKQAFLRKMKELRHIEVLKPNDWRKLGKAAFFGAVAGAGAGALVEHLPQIAEFIGEHISGVARIGDIAGDIGHAAGETAGNAGQTIGEAAGDILSGARDLAGHIPNPEYPDLGGIPQVTTEAAEGAGQATHEAIAQVPESLSAQDTSSLATDTAKAAKEQALGALTSNPEFLEKTAAAVGESISQSNLAVDEAIRAAGMDPTQLSAEAYENIRMNVQHKMEGLANEAFDHAAGATDNLDPSHLAEIVKQGHDEFVTSLSETDTHQLLLKSASAALKDHLTVQQEVVENLSQVLHSTPDLATDVMTAHGDSVGQMLVDHGYNITWGATDADILGAHIAANYNQLSSMWGAMAQVENLPSGIHFPVSLIDLPNLVEKARSGDPEALQKLKDALHWIPAGKKFTILNAEQLTKILASLKK